MKTSKILISTFVAAAAMNLPALADDVSLTDGQNVNIGTTGTGAGNTYIVPTGTTFESDRGSWIHWCSSDSDSDAAAASGMALGTADAPVSLSGSGFLGLAYHGGNGGNTYTVNLQNTNATNFSGQLTVVNSWYSPTNVILSGESWANTEYVSAWVSRESGKNWLWSRGDGSTAANMENDTLTLAGNTTLAGIRGAAQGVSSGSVTDANAREFVVAQSSGTTLTLAGEGSYSFYGTVGTADTRLSIEKTGTGTQTLGGTSYLDSVSVSAGTLALGGTATLGTVSVSGGTLSLDGTVNLSSEITVSGNGSVTVANTVVFELENLTPGEGGVYTLVSGTTLGNDFTSLGKANVLLNGESLAGRQTATFDSAGTVTISSVANLVWSSGTWDVESSQSWTNNGVADVFYDGDNVTFDTANAEVTVSGTVAPGAMTVSQATSLTGTGTVNVAAANLTTTAALTLGDGVVLDLGSTDSATSKSILGSGRVKFTSTASGHGATLTLGSGFTGTIEYSGKFNTSNGTSNPNAKFALSNGSMWGSNTIANDIHFLTDYQIGDSTPTTIVLNGNLTQESGTTLTIGGTEGTNVTFGGTATLGTVTQSEGTVNISGSATIGTLSLSGGTFSVAESGTATVSGNLSMTTGSATVLGALSVGGKISLSASGTLNVGNDSGSAATLTAARLYMSDSSTENQTNTLNVKRGAELNITGTSSWADVSGDWQKLSVLLGHWKSDSVMNVAGTLNALGAEINLGYTAGATLTVQDGGVVNAKGFYRPGGNVTGTLVVESGGRVNVGAGTSAGAIRNLSAVTLHAGSTLGALDSWSSSNNMTLSDEGKVVVDTQKYDAENKTSTVDATTISLSGIISGNGGLKKTGEGTLTLSGANTFSGGVEIEKGVVEAANDAALGAGTVTISGGQLSVGQDVTLDNTAITIVLGSAYESLAAIIGEGALANDVTITLTKAEETALALAAETSMETFRYKIFEEGTTLATSASESWFTLGEGWNDGSWTYAYDNGILTLSMIPEPSAFGLLAGLGALALVAARRRRKA